jgi:pimeloyl-ACP methyl ester carboxylesterase
VRSVNITEVGISGLLPFREQQEESGLPLGLQIKSQTKELLLMFRFISSKLAGFISVLVAFVSPLSAQSFNSSENQNMEFIAHKQIGSGKEKVLVMHHWMGDSTSYDSMLPYLNTDDYTYVFVDLRGYGRSKEMQGAYSVEEASADAMKLIDSLAWNKFRQV